MGSIMATPGYYQILASCVERGDILWQVTIVATEGSTPAKPGMKMLVPLTQKVHGNLGGGELEHLLIQRIRSEQPEQPILQSYALTEQGDGAGLENELPTSMICGGKVTLFIEPLIPPQLLQIVGAGHCGRALAHLAGLCGFHARLIDNRRDILADIPADICSDKAFSDFSDLDRILRFGPSALIVIMTHGHTHDQHALEQCLGKPCRYLGMIGSAKKVSATLESLRAKGFSSDDLERVHAPVGLPIGSQTPYEIAISILAQLIQITSGIESRTQP